VIGCLRDSFVRVMPCAQIERKSVGNLVVAKDLGIIGPCLDLDPAFIIGPGLAVRVPHMAAAAIIGETGNGLNPL
jgi:hypothetical protein